MRTLQLILAAAAAILAVIPLAIFLVVWAVSGFGTATHWAAVYLLLWSIVMGLVPLGIALGLAWKGLPFVLAKSAAVMETTISIGNRVDRLTARAGNAAVKPNIWLYSRVAWLRAFVAALWREFVPGRSRA